MLLPKSVLEACVRSTPPTGTTRACFERSVAMVMDRPTAALMVAVFRPPSEEEREGLPEAPTMPFLHAFVDLGDGSVVSPATYELCGHRLIPYPRETYLAHYGARDVRRFLRAEVVRFAKAVGFAEHLLKGRRLRTDKPFATALLDHLGVRHGVRPEHGGIVPLGDAVSA